MKKNFIDEAKIKVKSGNGGNGALIFHKEKYVEYGGPSGGDGGNGGSIYFIADKNENNLLKFTHKKKYFAENGKNGAKQNKNGANGKDLYISVPLGTEIYNNQNKKICDLIFDKQLFLIQKGGKGGRGNASFKSSKNKAPNLYELGEQIEEITIYLNLKVLADVGIIGFPNVGKSTFVQNISNAKPEIANYEFTTINPHLGVVNFKGKSFVITDLPGIIEGAYKNVGMGLIFLKHLERTKLILHFVDPTELKVKQNYDIIRKEIISFSEKLFNLPEIIVITKSDLIDNEIKKWIINEFNNKKIFFISSYNKNEIEKLLSHIFITLKQINDDDDESEELTIIFEKSSDEFIIDKINNNHYIISGKYVEYWSKRIPLTTNDNFNRLWQKLKNKKIIDKLEKMGLKENDIIEVKNSNFLLKYKI